MTVLTRKDSVRDALTLRRAFERMSDEPFAFSFPEYWLIYSFEPMVDMAEEENAYIVKASIPGVKPEDVEVTLQNNVLTISGETKEEKEIQEKAYHMRERRYGSFMRSLPMPTQVKAEEIEAHHKDGVLTVRLPKSEVSKPKKIEVKAQSTNGI